MRYFYFVRHGESHWNAISRMQGRRDSDLTELGCAQADANGHLLAALDIEALFASPLARARQTAEIVQGHVDLDVSYDARVMEWDCGDWSGELYEDVKRNWPTEWAALEADRFHFRGPNCENYPDMIARATPFLGELLATPFRSLAVISHGIIGRVMIGILIADSEAAMLKLRQPNDVVYRVSLPPTGTGSGSRKIHRYVAATGPYSGIVARA